VLTAAETVSLQEHVPKVAVDDALVDYMLSVVDRTRNHEALALGVSPRGAQALFRASQALALLEGRDYVLPDDIKRLIIPVFAHRVVINTRVVLGQRTAEHAERILQDILTLVDVPL
jgi:MoxR-like ATPase